MTLTPRTLLFLGLTLLGQNSAANQVVPVCHRSSLVIESLEENTKLRCRQITEDVLSRLDHFQIGFNPHLVEVKAGDLSGLTSARFLYLNCNKNLASIPGDLTVGMENLEYLAVHTNPSLTALPEGLFSSLPESTKAFLLMGNGLTSLPESFYTYFAARKTPFDLYLKGNRFTPETLRRIQDLFHVELDVNGELPHMINR